jgi:transcriptional regulator with XRE-family HTH domain
MQEEILKRQMFAKRLNIAKSARDMTNTDIMDKAKELNRPMRKSQVSQFLHGRFLPTEDRAFFWAKILRVDPLWLLGYGSDEDLPLIYTLEEENKEIQELIKLFSSMTAERRRLLLQIAKQFRFPFESDGYTLELKDPDIKFKK